MRFAPGPVRFHQQAYGGLVEAVGGHRGLGDLARHVGFTREQGRLGEEVPRLAQQPHGPGARVRDPEGVGLAHQHVAGSEQVERALSRRGGERRLVGEPLPRLGDEPCRVVEVHPDGLGRTQPVAVPPAGDHLRAQRRPQPADERRHVLGRAARRTVVPERVDDAVGRHDPLPVDREQRQQAAGLPADGDRRGTGLDRDGPGQVHCDVAHCIRVARQLSRARAVSSRYSAR